MEINEDHLSGFVAGIHTVCFVIIIVCIALVLNGYSEIDFILK